MNRLRLAVLGVAHDAHAGSYMRALTQRPDAEIVALYEPDERLRERFVRDFAIADAYHDPRPLLDRQDVDAVVVCSSTDEHAALVIAAAQTGRHVLCEKPIATTVEDATAMIQACDAAQVQLHLAFVCRFYPMVRQARDMVAAGQIGRVLGILGGNRGRPPLDYPAWICDPLKAGGGALMDHSVHVTDAMRYVLGSEVATVFAETGNLFQTDLAVEDSALMLLTFRNGAAGSVDPSWSVPAQHPYHYDFYLRLVGTEGTLTLDDTRQAIRLTRDGGSGRGHTLESFGPDIDAALVQHFVHCVRHGEAATPYASGFDGLQSLKIVLAAYESTRTGQAVAI